MEARNKRVLFGCLGGCGLVALLLVGSCVGFAVWLHSPGEVLDPRLLLGPETTGYVELTLRLEDPGTANFIEVLVRGFGELNRRNDSPLPDRFERLIEASQLRGMRKDVERLFPIVAAWTALPGEDRGDDEHVFTLSARGMGHQMIVLDFGLGVFLGSTGATATVRHAGDKIYVFPDDNGSEISAFIRKGTVFVTSDVGSARAVLDRLKRNALRIPIDSGLQELLDGLPADRSLRGAVINTDGELLRLIRTLSGPTADLDVALWNQARGATVSAGFAPGEVFAGSIEILGPNSDWAERNAPSLGQALVTLLQRTDIDLTTEVGASGNRVEVAFTTARILDQIELLDN